MSMMTLRDRSCARASRSARKLVLHWTTRFQCQRKRKSKQQLWKNSHTNIRSLPAVFSFAGVHFPAAFNFRLLLFFLASVYITKCS